MITTQYKLQLLSLISWRGMSLNGCRDLKTSNYILTVRFLHPTVSCSRDDFM